MLDRLDDTIVAVSSAPGVGLLGIVRLSGPEAVAIADRMARTATGEPLAQRSGSTRVSGDVLPDADVTLPAEFYVFRTPHSYTRQDMIEIHTIGSPAVLELIRRRALGLGAVAAEPGEFTARAFLNGALDLTSAEAVAGIIRAQSDTQLRASRRMREGAVSQRTTQARDELAELVALIEAEIDFAEEPIEFITPVILRDRLGKIEAGLDALLAGSASAERLDVLPRILLFGPPNVGKSTLMNRLSGTRRAICAAAAGTTRDILSAPIRLGRGEAVLLDAAGVDPSEDELIAQAREMTHAAAERVDLVCLVADVTDPDPGHLAMLTRTLDVARWVVAANKCDLLPNSEGARAAGRMKGWNLGPVCLVSALKGTGMNELRATLCEALHHRGERDATAADPPHTFAGGAFGDDGSTTLGEAVALSERQRSAIAEASRALQRAIGLAEQASETSDRADLLAFELREALDALGAVTGEVATEDLLAQIFANFCIGK